MTEDDIKKIKLGAVLKTLKKSKNPKVVETIEKLISAWKKICKHKNTENTPKKTLDVFPDEYLVKEGERVSRRNNIRKTLYANLKLKINDDKDKNDLIEKIVAIEEKLYEIKKDETSYINRGLEIIHNIKDEKNTEFREKIIKGEITPEELCTMDALEMMNKNKQKEREQLIEDKVNQDRSDWNEKHANAIEGVYKCKACGGTKTKTSEMQTRSADEPMTLYITCLNCGKTWRG